MIITRQILLDYSEKFLNDKIDKKIIQDFAWEAITPDDFELLNDETISDTIFEWDNEDINFEINKINMQLWKSRLVTDMILWDKVLSKKNIILKKENWELLWQPFIKTSDQPESKAYYRFGWFIDERNGHKVIEHGGANVGFRSYYTRFVNDDLSIIIMTNTNEANPGTIVRALSEYYFRTK